jgi:hypothetical protein
MIGIVNEIGTTQAGKPKVKIGEVWFYPGRCPIDGMVVGKTIEYFCSPFKTSSGKELMGLESWTPTIPQAPLPNDAPGAANAPLNEAELRFVSNVVGSAVAGGSCKTPSEVRSWFLSAKAALRPPDEFDDEVPY